MVMASVRDSAGTFSKRFGWDFLQMEVPRETQVLQEDDLEILCGSPFEDYVRTMSCNSHIRVAVREQHIQNFMKGSLLIASPLKLPEAAQLACAVQV